MPGKNLMWFILLYYVQFMYMLCAVSSFGEIALFLLYLVFFPYQVFPLGPAYESDRDARRGLSLWPQQLWNGEQFQEALWAGEAECRWRLGWACVCVCACVDKLDLSLIGVCVWHESQRCYRWLINPLATTLLVSAFGGRFKTLISVWKRGPTRIHDNQMLRCLSICATLTWKFLKSYYHKWSLWCKCCTLISCCLIGTFAMLSTCTYLISFMRPRKCSFLIATCKTDLYVAQKMFMFSRFT